MNRVANFLKSIVCTLLGCVFGYAGYFILVVLHEVYRSRTASVPYDWTRVAYTCIYPAGITLLLIGEVHEFIRSVSMGDVLCYLMMGAAAFWFCRLSRRASQLRNDLSDTARW